MIYKSNDPPKEPKGSTLSSNGFIYQERYQRDLGTTCTVLRYQKDLGGKNT